MFKSRLVTIHLSDILFLLAYTFLTGAIFQIFPYDKQLALYLLIPAVISYIAYVWKFWVTSVKKEDEGINSSETNLKGNFKTKLP